MKTMTIKEAIEQGYTHWGREDETEQSLNSIEGTTAEDLESPYYRPVLAETKANYMGVDGNHLAERICDDLTDDPECLSFDYDDILDTIKKSVDFDKLAEDINKGLESKPYYFLTDIRLIP